MQANARIALGLATVLLIAGFGFADQRNPHVSVTPIAVMPDVDQGGASRVTAELPQDQVRDMAY